MTARIEVIDMPTREDFVDKYVTMNRPVVVRGLEYDVIGWQPDRLRQRVGDLEALIFGTLFDLEDVQTLADYLDTYFGQQGPLEDNIPYVRWYGRLRNVEFPWGDEALARIEGIWRAPECLPVSDLILPNSSSGAGTNPVTDTFPYRSILVAARGARTRMHRDPFSSDAVVCQFFGTKELALYRPERRSELTADEIPGSVEGFVDVRAEALDRLSIEPDYQGSIAAGEMVYIPHDWLHDVIAIDDSVSVTWNFVHKSGSQEYNEYLKGGLEDEPHFEILQYFQSLSGPG